MNPRDTLAKWARQEGALPMTPETQGTSGGAEETEPAQNEQSTSTNIWPKIQEVTEDLPATQPITG